MNAGTRVASKDEEEKIGWSICNAYRAFPGLKWCCCDDQISCFSTKESCVQFCAERRRVCDESKLS